MHVKLTESGKDNQMYRSRNKFCGWVLSLGMCLAVSGALGLPSRAQQKVAQTAGVSNTKMGAYEALAEMSLEAFQKGDSAKAAELARVLERTWDRGESGERAADKPNHELYDQIDRAMDVFIGPIMNYSKKAPDPAAVEAAYNDFLGKLKQAD